MKLELLRLNHILIPATKAERDRLRRLDIPRRLRLFTWFFTRLSREGRWLLAAVAALSIFGVDVGRTESHVLLLATGALLASSLLFTRPYRLHGVSVTATAPRRVTIGDELCIALTLHNRGQRSHRALRIESPLLPWDGTWLEPPECVAELAPGDSHTVTARARFAVRGEHQLDRFRTAALLPLGLSQGAPLWSEGVRFVVVPKIARVVTLDRLLERGEHAGSVAQLQRAGEATTLLGVRPYRPGDPVRDLHARSWARHGAPVIREYQDETFTRVAVIVDTDVHGVSPVHLEVALSLAAGVVNRLAQSEAIVELLVIGEHFERLSSGRSAATLEQTLELLAAAKPGPAFTSERALAQLGPHLERLSAVVLIALDWSSERSGLARAIRARGRSCLALVVGQQTQHGHEVTTVSADAIARGEALTL